MHLQTQSNDDFSRQRSDQANGSNFSENQECGQVSQVEGSIERGVI